MTLRYSVGVKIRNRTDQVTVEAEDALHGASEDPGARRGTGASKAVFLRALTQPAL
jgi:hypothetical protein